MNKKTWTVYMHTSPNNRVYVGITSKKPTRRWDNGNGYSYNPYFSNAIKKYGWENFKHEILYEGLTKEEACIREQELIKKYKSNQFKYGYNQSVGGQGGRYGVPFTDEEKAIRSKPIRCITNGKEYASAVEAGKDLNIPPGGISQCLRGRRIKTHGYRFEYLNESNDQIREEYIPHNARAVIELDSNKEFESVSKAAEHYNLNKSSVSDVCKGRLSQTGGHKFRFKGKPYAYKPPKDSQKMKAVINRTTGEAFRSVSEACRKYDVARSMITSCCRGIITNVKGHKWEYIQDDYTVCDSAQAPYRQLSFTIRDLYGIGDKVRSTSESDTKKELIKWRA
jgi:predicted GIY-YIG superfamily endonuclease